MNTGYCVQKEQERPVRRTLCGVLRRDTNWKCLILTFLIQGCLVAIAWCRNTQVTKVTLNFEAFPITSTKQVSPCDEGYVYIPTAFVIMLYLLYLVECWHSKARIQLSLKKTDLNSVYHKIHEMREAQPIVWWKAICYHYVRRQRQITRYRNGGAYTTSQVFYERVNSSAVASYFYHTACGMKDISKDVGHLESHLATRIQFSKGFIFANVTTAAEFEEQRSAFFQEQERVDDYMEMRECLELSNINFKDSVVAWRRPEALPWFARSPVFWLASSLLLSWPIRILLELNTAQLHYKITKLFGGNYPSNPNFLALQRPLLYSDYLTHMQRRRRLRHRSTAPAPNRQSPLVNRSAAQTPPSSALEPSDPSPSTTSLNSPTQEPCSGGKKALTAHWNSGWSPSLPRSVTLMLGLSRFYDYVDHSTQGTLTKRSTFDSNEDASTIPTYSQALLLLNGPNGPKLDPEPTTPTTQHINSSSWSSHTALPFPHSASHLTLNSQFSRLSLSSPTADSRAETPGHNSQILTNAQVHGLCSDQNDENETGLDSCFTGVEIDLTEPVVSSTGLEGCEDYSSSPPTYLEALQTSRPVFLPALTRLRRCLTERDISGTSRSWDRDRERLRSWLNHVSPSFLQRFQLPFSISSSSRNSTTNILGPRTPRDSVETDKEEAEESFL